MFIIVLPAFIIPIVLLFYTILLITLSRKLFLRWQNSFLSTLEFIFLNLAAWVIPIVGPIIAFVVLKFKK